MMNAIYNYFYPPEHQIQHLFQDVIIEFQNLANQQDAFNTDQQKQEVLRLVQLHFPNNVNTNAFLNDFQCKASFIEKIYVHFDSHYTVRFAIIYLTKNLRDRWTANITIHPITVTTSDFNPEDESSYKVSFSHYMLSS